MGHMDALVLVTIGIFLVGVIFDAGQKAARLSSLERWQAQCADNLIKIDGKIDRLLERRAEPREAVSGR